MIDLPYESLIGVSYGLAYGFVGATLVGLLAVGVRLWRARPLPLGVGVVIVVPLVIGTGVSTGIFDPSVGPSQTLRLVTAAVVASVLGVLATSYGNRVATELPRDRALPIVRGNCLSADAIDAVDAAGQVTIRPTGAIREFEGYPPLAPTLRTALEDGAWRFPADLQLSELERRLERRLRSEYALPRVDVSIDGRGQATIAAAPPDEGVATTLSDDVRAVTISGLLPIGIEPDDEVAIGVDGETVRGTVLATGGETEFRDVDEDDLAEALNGRSDDRRFAGVGFDGGRGRLTVAVRTVDARRLLEEEACRVAVVPSGDNPALEAATLLSSAERPVTAVESPDESIDPADILGVRRDERWRFAVDGERDRLADADMAFVAAPREVSAR
ncbi:hypothetical protein ACFQGT_07195 [Natrialbaceae archaeon GCM10025810]|uniref:hypothetical protein n=1 Tax=Halovalidus salilacus TaxID=3075124 RepID=UPI00361ABDC8